MWFFLGLAVLAVATLCVLFYRGSARWSGKVVTFLQLATVPVILFAAGMLPAMIAAVGVASLLCIVDYSGAAWATLRAPRATIREPGTGSGPKRDEPTCVQ